MNEEGSDKSERNSVETRISLHKYYNNAGDGPQVSQKSNDAKQMSLHKLTSMEKSIINGSVEYENNLETIFENRMKSIQLVLEQEHRKASPRDAVSNEYNIRETFKNIQCIVNQLRVTNSSIKSQISKDLEQIGCCLLKQDFNAQIESNSRVTTSPNSVEVQKLQTILVCVLEYITKLDVSLYDANSQIEKLSKPKGTDGTEDKDKTSQDEDDIFSVEELSWDENQSLVERLKLDRNMLMVNDKCVIPAEEKTSDKNLPVRLSRISSMTATPPLNHSREVSNAGDLNEQSNEDSIKVQHSNSLVQHSIHNSGEGIRDNVELSNSFHEIKKKFENLHICNVPTKSQKKDVSVVSITDQGEPTTIESGHILHKYKKSVLDNDASHHKHNESIDEYVDNSAFLVSSIDSFSNSICLSNADNNNNKFSEKFKVGNTNLERKETSPSIAIDVIEAGWVSKNHSNSTNANGTHSKQSKFGTDKRNEHILQVELMSPKSLIVQSSCNTNNSENQYKHSSSSSDQILATGKHTGRLKPSTDKENIGIEESSAMYHQVIEMIDSEKSYINSLFILSNVLYSRIKVINMISLRNFKIIFPDCIHDLYKVHSRFGDRLTNGFQQILNKEENYEKKRHHIVHFGQIFLENLEQDNWNMFVLYRQYFARSKMALNTFDKLRNQSHKFDRLNLQHNEHCRGLDLGYFIKLPLQRLSIYLKLMRKILENLPITESDERVSVLAVEHLLHCFLNEMESKYNLNISTKSDPRNEYSSGSSNISMRCASLNEMAVNDITDQYYSSEYKCGSIPRIFTNKIIKKFTSETKLLIDEKSNSKSRINSVLDAAVGSNINEVQLMIGSSNHCKPANPFQPSRSLEKINKILGNNSDRFKIESLEQFNSKETSISKQRFFANSNHQIKTIFSSKFDNTQTRLTSFKNDVSKSLSLSKLQDFDSESIKSVTDECSVCLNSQEEFEVDTSLEDDDKTFVGANDLGPVNRNDTTRTSSPMISIIPESTTKYPEIEFSPNLERKCQASKLSTPNKLHINSLDLDSLDNSWRALINIVLSDEAGFLIYKKVDNVVTLLCNVVMEIFFSEYEDSKVITKNETKSQRYYRVCPDPPIERIMKSSNEFSDYDKSSHKKFSIKHLFSLRRRGCNNQSSESVQSITANIRSPLRISLQKKMSRDINK